MFKKLTWSSGWAVCSADAIGLVEKVIAIAQRDHEEAPTVAVLSIERRAQLLDDFA
jgi:hypothetical protein